MRRHRVHLIGCAIAAAAAGALSVGSAAFAEVYGVPGYVEVGTNGSNAGSSNDYPYLGGVVAVSQGGCARSAVSVAVGGGCGASGVVAVGLSGSPSSGIGVAVSDGGSASGCHAPLWFDCITGIAVSGSGPASARELALSGDGPVTSGTVGVSGSNTASGSVSVSGTGAAVPRYDGYNFLAVSGTGDAHSSQGTAVSGTGNADGRDAAVAPDGNASASNGVAVSVTGDADGGIAGISVFGSGGSLP